jgi:cytosine/adenosine deaminase-related metal-dependent hydrolase
VARSVASVMICRHPWVSTVSKLAHPTTGSVGHATCSADIISQMRLALQLARHSTNQPLLDAGKFPANLKGSTEQAFNLGTVQGARAVHMDQTGSLAEGKLADIVIFDASSPSMICAAEHDPVAAVVRHSSIRDIETVIIDGIVRKEAGHLLPIKAESEIALGGEKQLAWKDVAQNLVSSRERIQSKIDKLDIEAGRKMLMEMWHIDPKVLEPVK